MFASISVALIRYFCTTGVLGVVAAASSSITSARELLLLLQLMLVVLRYISIPVVLSSLTLFFFSQMFTPYTKWWTKLTLQIEKRQNKAGITYEQQNKTKTKKKTKKKNSGKQNEAWNVIHWKITIVHWIQFANDSDRNFYGIGLPLIQMCHHTEMLKAIHNIR